MAASPTSAAFGFREVALGGGWWEREGPAILAVAQPDDQPRAVVWRRGRWRAIDPETRAETQIDAVTATGLMPRAYMIYPSLPEQVTTAQIWRFAIFGARGEVARLLVAAAAATLAALLIPIATSSVLGFAVPDGRISLLIDMMVVLVAAAIGSAGFQVARSVALIRLGTHIDLRLQAAVWGSGIAAGRRHSSVATTWAISRCASWASTPSGASLRAKP